MKLIKLAYKTIINNKAKSFVLALFFFIASMIFVVFNSFIGTIKDKMEITLINSLTGEIQIRQSHTDEKDMFPTNKYWTKMGYLNNGEKKYYKDELSKIYKDVNVMERIRYNVQVVAGNKSESSYVLAFDPKYNYYKDTIPLSEGEYLSPQSQNEIVLPKDLALKLDVKVNDKVRIISQTANGESKSVEVKVVGIGSTDVLSQYGYNAIYTDLDTGQEVSGYKDGEVSDLIVYFRDKDNAKKYKNEILDTCDKYDATITTWQDMGGFVSGIISTYTYIFETFLVIMIIIIIVLISNLVYMMTLEKRGQICTLRAIGYSKGQNIFIFMAETVIIAMAGCLTGIIVGSIIVLCLSKVTLSVGMPLNYILGTKFQVKYYAGKLPLIALLMIVISMLGSFYPSYKAANLNPSEALSEL